MSLNPSLKATETWKSFAGMYGADSVLRKFGDTPPPEWVAMIGRLRDFEIDRAMRRLAYGAKANVPTLPEFVKLARTIASDDWDEPQVSEAPRIEQDSGDDWDARANYWLLKHVTEQSLKGIFYCCQATLDRRHRLTHPDPAVRPEATQESKDLTAPLVAYKNAWARDMRETQAERLDVPIEYQTKHWRADMALAEAEVDKVRVRYAQARAA